MSGSVSDAINHRLATYGTLAPGEINESQLAGLNGKWSRGTVRGHLVEEGWGAEHGCPGIVLADDGEPVPVHVFHSADLPEHWQRLDAFEGDQYQRRAVVVQTDREPVEAWIYALAKV